MSVNVDNEDDIDNRLFEIEDISQFAAMTPTGQYILTDDIEIGGRWTPIPIGSGSNNIFSGNFYGNGKTITFSGNYPDNLPNYGIFGRIENAIIRDLEVVYNKTVEIYAGSGEKNAGGLVGLMTGNSRLINCVVRGAGENVVFDHRSENGTVNIGGMVGAIREGQISNCFSELNVRGKKTLGIQSMHTGGLVGAYYSSMSIVNCYSKGNVVLENNIHSAAGGLIGYDTATPNIRECFAKGNVTAFTITGGTLFIGGLLGLTSAEIENSYATGNVKATNNNGTIQAGGLIGSFSNSIINSYATGNVKVTAEEGTAHLPYYYGCVNVGGLIGLSSGNVNKCWAKGNVKVERESDGVITIHAGGLIGTVEPSNIVKTIRDCYALGDITIDHNSSGVVGLLAGGLIGFNSSNRSGSATFIHPIPIFDSFAEGNVKIKSGSIWTPYSIAAGGIVGWTDNNIDNIIALGKRITASRDGNATALFAAYRILGNGPVSRAYALDEMQIGTSTGGYNATVITNPVTNGNNNGADVTLERTKEASFWTGAGSTMGWSSDIWDTTGVEVRGYPLLRGVGGQ